MNTTVGPSIQTMFADYWRRTFGRSRRAPPPTSAEALLERVTHEAATLTATRGYVRASNVLAQHRNLEKAYRRALRREAMYRETVIRIADYLHGEAKAEERGEGLPEIGQVPVRHIRRLIQDVRDKHYPKKRKREPA